MTERPQNKNLRPFKKGQSGNPGGRKRLPEDLRAFEPLTREECNRLIAKYARMTKAGLTAAIQSVEIPMLELTIASILAQAAKGGDYSRLSFLLDRAIGRPVPVDEKQPQSIDEPLTKDQLKGLVQIARGK